MKKNLSQNHNNFMSEILYLDNKLKETNWFNGFNGHLMEINSYSDIDLDLCKLLL